MRFKVNREKRELTVGSLTVGRRSATWLLGEQLVRDRATGEYKPYPDNIVVLTSSPEYGAHGHFLYVLRNDFRDVIVQFPWPRRWWPK